MYKTILNVVVLSYRSFAFMAITVTSVQFPKSSMIVRDLVVEQLDKHNFISISVV